MILSERKISEELAFYRALNNRSRLTGKDAKKLSVLERGYLGECIYDEVFDDIGHGSVFVFRDIYLQIEDGVAQYDALIISDGEVVVNEIKNFSGLYRYEEGKWFVQSFEVPEEPMSQLKRAITKLMRVRYNSKLNFDVTGKIVFPHIEFRLNSNNRELWDLAVMRPDLRNYLKGFKNAYAGRDAEEIAKVIEAHIIPNPFFNKCADFEAVRKGFYCGACGSFELIKSRYHYKCSECDGLESRERHIVRAISDFKALFGKTLMTKKLLMSFINHSTKNRNLQKILNKYCRKFYRNAHTYYEFNYIDWEEALKDHKIRRRYDRETG